MAQLQQEVFNDINTWLSNPDNAGQALISAVFNGSDGKEHKAWEIVEIESKANSQAQAEKTELQEITSIIFFAMGLDPSSSATPQATQPHRAALTSASVSSSSRYSLPHCSSSCSAPWR